MTEERARLIGQQTALLAKMRAIVAKMRAIAKDVRGDGPGQPGWRQLVDRHEPQHRSLGDGLRLLHARDQPLLPRELRRRVGLGALASNTTRTVVRQISILRPTNLGVVKRVSRGAAITFVDTVRPARPELAPATVRFVFYRRVTGGAWLLHAQRDVATNAFGQAATTWTFPATGEWYVRSQARPTPYNANSVWGSIERYSVR